MVLTNFEWWAHGDAVVDPNHGLPVNSQNVDMFNPRMVQQRLNTATAASAVSHISSNGYYGFSYVNAAHQPADNNSHTNNNEEQNITHLNNNNSNNNNNNITCVPNANDFNGMDVGAAVDGAAGLFSNGINTTKRCKKRYFVSDDDYAKCALLNGCDSGGGVAGMGMEDVAVAGIDVCAAAKRCRFDDDYSAAQYCNDFFSLPSTQIGTQACLMDTEDTLQQQQPQQVDVNMGATNNNNQLTTNTTTKGYERTIEKEANSSNSILSIYHNNNNNNNNDNTVKQNNKYFYNNPVSEYASINTTTYTLTGCGSTDSAHANIDNNNAAATKGKQVGGHNQNTTYQLHQALFPATSNRSTPPTPAEGDNEESAGVATLYAKTHGGSFYQFTASHFGNQQYIEDI